MCMCLLMSHTSIQFVWVMDNVRALNQFNISLLILSYVCVCVCVGDENGRSKQKVEQFWEQIQRKIAKRKTDYNHMNGLFIWIPLEYIYFYEFLRVFAVIKDNERIHGRARTTTATNRNNERRRQHQQQWQQWWLKWALP